MFEDQLARVEALETAVREVDASKVGFDPDAPINAYLVNKDTLDALLAAMDTAKGET